MRDPRTALWLGAAALVAIAVVLLGWAAPPVRSVVSTDRLGPEPGEPVADYLARARDSLTGSDAAGHWALVSFSAGITSDHLTEHVAGLRISQVLYHVPIDRVYTPLVTVPVPAGAVAVLDSARVAANALGLSQFADTRTARATAVAAARLHAGCACTAAVIVRGRLDQLRDLAAHPDIRAVQALPADAGAGAFAVLPFLPEQTGSAVPGPDDGPIPDN
jgi:hypothetical protein